MVGYGFDDVKLSASSQVYMPELGYWLLDCSFAWAREKTVRAAKTEDCAHSGSARRRRGDGLLQGKPSAGQAVPLAAELKAEQDGTCRGVVDTGTSHLGVPGPHDKDKVNFQ